MSRRVLLHVGTHKTGSTSLQLFLRDQNEAVLGKVGASFPEGFLLPTMHSELPLLSIRAERTWPARIRFPETQSKAWLTRAKNHVHSNVRGMTSDILVYSHEDLSYLRFDDEFERLRDLLSPRSVTVVILLRDKREFLRSYREQILAMGFTSSHDPTSFAYVEPDSWLVDYDELVDGYQRYFGIDEVKVLDYDAIRRTDGSVIPSIVGLLGVERSSLPPLDGYFFNQTGAQLRPSEAQLAAIRERIAEQSR
jgi:hypothetical protein